MSPSDLRQPLSSCISAAGSHPADAQQFSRPIRMQNVRAWCLPVFILVTSLAALHSTSLGASSFTAPCTAGPHQKTTAACLCRLSRRQMERARIFFSPTFRGMPMAGADGLRRCKGTVDDVANRRRLRCYTRCSASAMPVNKNDPWLGFANWSMATAAGADTATNADDSFA